MISKNARLTERELKKVLQRWKPFFSYGIVVNYFPNLVERHRFGIVIWSKSVSTNVTRNYFRRYFYTMVAKKLETFPQRKYYDFVFVVKKEKILDKRIEKSIRDFAQDIQFLLKKLETSLFV